MRKNIVNAVCIAYYVTVQDIAFFCAANLYSPNTDSLFGVVSLIIAILLMIVGTFMIIWQFWIVNNTYEQDK
jgi:hypothetical protein